MCIGSVPGGASSGGNQTEVIEKPFDGQKSQSARNLIHRTDEILLM